MNRPIETQTPEQWAAEAARLREQLAELVNLQAALAATNKDLERQIVESRLAEEDLRQREGAFRALAENSPDEISRFDREFRHLYINRRPERFLGKTLDESGFPERLVGEWKAHFQKVFDTGRPGMMEYEATAENGSCRFFQSRLVPEFTPDGEVDSVLIVSRDITLRKQAEEAADKAKADAERADQTKSEVLLRLRQEMQTLLKLILWFAQIKMENSTAEQRESLEQVLEGVRHRLDLINEVLDDSLTEVAQP